MPPQGLIGEGRVGRAYERFLELPVRLVIVVLWLAGASLMGLCAWALFYLLWLSMGVAAGA